MQSLVTGIAMAALTVVGLVYKEYLPDHDKAAAALVLGVIILFPVIYRTTGGVTVETVTKSETPSHWIWIPFIFVGFCELATVVFDRFKPPAEKSRRDFSNYLAGLISNVFFFRLKLRKLVFLSMAINLTTKMVSGYLPSNCLKI